MTSSLYPPGSACTWTALGLPHSCWHVVKPGFDLGPRSFCLRGHLRFPVNLVSEGVWDAERPERGSLKPTYHEHQLLQLRVCPADRSRWTVDERSRLATRCLPFPFTRSSKLTEIPTSTWGCCWRFRNCETTCQVCHDEAQGTFQESRKLSSAKSKGPSGGKEERGSSPAVLLAASGIHGLQVPSPKARHSQVAKAIKAYQASASQLPNICNLLLQQVLHRLQSLPSALPHITIRKR